MRSRIKGCSLVNFCVHSNCATSVGGRSITLDMVRVVVRFYFVPPI